MLKMCLAHKESRAAVVWASCTKSRAGTARGGREDGGADAAPRCLFSEWRDSAFGDANLSLFTVSEFADGNERKTNSRTSSRSSASMQGTAGVCRAVTLRGWLCCHSHHGHR